VRAAKCARKHANRNTLNISYLAEIAPALGDGRSLLRRGMDACDLLQDSFVNLFRAAHAVGHQADIRWADPQLSRHSRIETQMQFVNVKQVVSVGVCRFRSLHGIPF